VSGSLAETIADLQDRAAQSGLSPAAWCSVTERLSTLKAGAGAALTTSALAMDGHQAAAEDEWPPEISEALQRLGWPDSWDPRSLGRLWDPVTPPEARGFVSGVKGTVFEHEVVDRVEAGDLLLPEGDGLSLAEDVQQPGWDAEVLDGDEVIGVVQMKATDSVGWQGSSAQRLTSKNRTPGRRRRGTLLG
jgi:hypothetical protein